MSLKANKSRLTGLTKEILLRWTDTQQYWRDAKGAEFDSRFMRELLPQVNQATAALEKLDELLNKIRNECE